MHGRCGFIAASCLQFTSSFAEAPTASGADGHVWEDVRFLFAGLQPATFRQESPKANCQGSQSIEMAFLVRRYVRRVLLRAAATCRKRIKLWAEPVGTLFLIARQPKVPQPRAVEPLGVETRRRPFEACIFTSCRLHPRAPTPQPGITAGSAIGVSSLTCDSSNLVSFLGELLKCAP